MEYEIFLGGQAVGTARVNREGLYYCFDCRCRLSGDVVYRINVRCGEKTESLGIPVPDPGGFGLRTKLPVKRLGEGEMEFRLVPRSARLEGKFVPLSPQEPFRYLKQLQDAFMQIRDGQVGVVIRDQE